MDNQIKRTILVVDDEQDIQDFLQMLLEDEGYDVLTAEDGKDGIEKALASSPDLITLDLTMPRHSGIRMFMDLKENSSTTDIPVIIITGIPGELADLISNPDLPKPEAFLEKPISRLQFLEVVENILTD